MGEGDQPVVVLVAAEEGGDEHAAADEIEPLLDAEDTLSDFDAARVREFFEIGERELAATDAGIEPLVRERVALLDVEK